MTIKTTRTKRVEAVHPIKLSDKQRELLIHAARPRRALKKKLDDAPKGTQFVGFTEQELWETASEIDMATEGAPSAEKKRLVAVLNKLEQALNALEEPAPPARDTSTHRAACQAGQIFQLKITLKDIDPPIWRRVQVPDCTLGDLHNIIEVAMGWDGWHMHQFIINGACYGPSPELGSDVEEEEDVQLSRVFAGRKKIRMVYKYDFGDGWQHDVDLERTVEREPKVTYPRCIDGARACPPDDVGGPCGYAEFVDAMTDPSHESHDREKEWYEDEFDPEEFVLDKVNRALRKVL